MDERNITPSRLPIRIGLVVTIIVVVFVAVTAISSVFMVDQTEVAIVTTFGKYTATKEAGLHFKLPFGIQRNYNVQTQVIQSAQFGYRTAEAGIVTRYSSGDYSEESTMLTGDLNIVDVEWIIQYRINDAKAWLFNTQDREKTIRDISQSVINQLVGDRAILDVIGPEGTAIEQQGQVIMNEKFNSYGLGIIVTTVKLQSIIPPAGVQAAFEDVNKAIQDMNRSINEGKESYNKEIPMAKGQADAIIQVAKGYATERINRANGDVARFLSVYDEYRRAPAVTRERLYYEMMEAVFQNETGVELIDDNLSNFIPLMNIGGGQQ
ncbi:MAG: FtsH protease activity modulator HflK [Spirochaetes bacterium]|nr:FtsH protease activity modulator HflK [Spirochaetota bacterium]